MSAWSPGRSAAGGPRILAHRGASAVALENTMEAFGAAASAGADGLELDVRRCASGEIVVFHDADLRRLTGRPERIARTGWSRLAQVVLRDGQRIPRLAEVLRAFPSLLVNVEIKPPGWGRELDVVARTLADVRAAAAEERVLVSSFDPLVVACVRACAPGVATGLLFEAGQLLPLRRGWLAHFLRPAAMHPQHLLASADRVAAWHRRGMAVNVWTVDDDSRARELAALGVDAIVTNDPARVRKALQHPARTQPELAR